MVTSNLGLVNKLTKKMYYRNEQYSFEDMFQEGVIGLMKSSFVSSIPRKVVGSLPTLTTGFIVM